MITPPLQPDSQTAGPSVVSPKSVVVRRQPLGLPAGSVRALLTLMILGLIWALLLLPEEKNVQVPLYLYYLMFLVLGHFYAAHGQSIAGPETGHASPLYLPRGSLRTLIILGFAAVFGYRYYVHQNLDDLFKVREPLLQQPYLPLIILAGFFIGVILNRMVLRLVGIRPWYQDVLAWVALLGTLGLSAEVMMQLIINPSVEPAQQLHLYQWHLVLAAIISFYFGLRS